ncbi:hypothetical protein HD599_000335 [Conyzicola lurida]|uniref:Uncharacterized protein n=1 Tax=Conyzicola lurida TaxID=1172621 RepID=A0A841AJ49_9MICO|nr:hypothetical protein [Conyzicola lurida]MBB5842012.1 hypothetical protein [Conyzicola lurida]
MSSDAAVITWLLDGDPAVRHQVLRDLVDARPEAVAAERARIATEGQGAALLAEQRPDGNWGGDSPADHWRHNVIALQTLYLLQPDPASAAVARSVALTRDRVRWDEEFGAKQFFDGEVEACINGRVLAAGSYFGEPSDDIAQRFVDEQLADGGWNCYLPDSDRSSFHSTICALEGLREYERAGGAVNGIAEAVARGEEYLLERRLLRSLSTGELIDRGWTRFSFPPRWHYDVLRGLDYFRAAGADVDPRMEEAVEFVRARRHADGRWPLSYAQETGQTSDLDEGPGRPSRWNTLRALRVLRWADQGVLI